MNTTGITPNQVVGYDVVDPAGNKIGSVDAAWVDKDSNDLKFIGVKTTPLFGKTHVVPADSAQIDQNNQQVTVPYSEDQIKNAPTYDTDATFTQDQENQIYSYFQNAGQTSGVSQAASVPVARTAGPAAGSTIAEQRFGPGSFPVDDLTYDLITLVHEKLRGMEVFDEYLQDAEGDDDISSFLMQLRQQDAQTVQQLLQLLGPRLANQTTAGTGMS